MAESTLRKSMKNAILRKTPKKRTMKALFKLISLFVLTACTSAGIFFISLGYLVSLYAEKPKPADVIIVLGGDNGLRVKKGAELYNDGYAPRVILTGIDARFYRPSHPDWRERRMRALGVPKKSIRIDTRSASSWEEALNSSRLMEKKGWKTAIVVSDPPHLFRLHRTWKKAFSGSAKQFILVPTKPQWWNPLLWWKNKKSYSFVISEFQKSLYYSVMYF
ncbi:YdcF family protein [Chlorobium phaeobacteroides]|jgi:uncharacterized SAM-binding protein YcdF (DUF218 family)|uniref:DUF218 domain-containing protein n=1 Tax=Chlorobium phaeobacteroides (strain DSM 266 / SMG 266 / 2430) TaxID=290317 RepID=A1BER8_CHLPD|nr:YdcF family protein [Chlorobium phaeobacteroides]ABL64895.1 protein of unknown function DUF218 [Chlorobium phaeobacteroides DSM 266]